MFTRPSSAQIASAYIGKAPQLEARIKQEKQTDNGLSPDLRKLLALQDLTSDSQHMGIDQALKGPTNPPTINQSYQDRAKQIIEAKMAKAKQDATVARKQQEGMIAKAGPSPVPEGIAQPKRQPEGIDQLTSNIGESYARGGIIAFSGEDSSFVQNMKALKDKFVSTFGETPEEKEARETRVALMKKNSPMGYFTKGASEYEGDRAVADFVAANPGIVNSPAFKENPVAYVKGVLAQKRAQPAKAPTAEENLDEKLRLLNRAPVPSEAPQEAPVNAPAANKPAAPRPAGPAAPAAPSAPIAKPTAQPSIANLQKLPPDLPPPEKGSPRDVMGKDMAVDPDVEMNRILAAREKLVGAPDTSQYQALIDELRGQKEKLQKKPAKGLESLMEYFGEIAAGPTTGRSGQSGAMASDRLRKRDLDKEKQVNALSERMIEAAQKQKDVEYGYKKEGFALSEGERAKVFERRFNAAKAAGESDDRAKQLAQQAVLEQAKIAATLEAARIGSSGRQGQLMDIAEALMKADKTGKLDLPSALKQAANIVGTASLAGTDVKNTQAYTKAVEALDNSPIGVIRTGKSPKAKLAQQEYETKIAELKQIHGITDGAGLNSLTAATGPTSSTVRSQADAIISGGR